MSPVRILISAGEASGEMYGAQLIKALRRREPSAEFFGVGGERMRAAGCDTVVDAKDLAVVGIAEILSRLPEIYGHFRKLIAEADKRRPDLAVVIDSPAFNWRVARQMHKRGIPVVYYVCPQFWAWRQGRVRLLRKYVDKALVIAVDGAHLARPGFGDAEIALAFALQHVAVGIDDFRHHAEERPRRRARLGRAAQPRS